MEACLGRPADQGMPLEDGECFRDEACRSLRVPGMILSQEAREPLEIRDRRAGIRDRRHGPRYRERLSFTGRGFLAFFPVALARNQRMTSSCA